MFRRISDFFSNNFIDKQTSFFKIQIQEIIFLANKNRLILNTKIRTKELDTLILFQNIIDYVIDYLVVIVIVYFFKAITHICFVKQIAI